MPLFPVILLLPALPVPLILLLPISLRFSTLLGRVRVRLLCQVSVMITSPIPPSGLMVALTGFDRVIVKASSASLRLSLRMGMLIVAVEALAGMMRVPVWLV